mmetsp:Transcript_27702/g.51984  ORF Transcript_27702/g.51984 Transcript_27702/m.51984 type:complete len:177 (-) Transcript_27702:140-670(-)
MRLRTMSRPRLSRGLGLVALLMAAVSLSRCLAFLAEANSRRGFLASAMLASLALPEGAMAAKTGIGALSLQNDNLDGYDFAGATSRLGASLNTGYDKVKPECEEVTVMTNGGSRTFDEETAKRYLCDRADLKKKKEEKQEFSYTKDAKEYREQLAAQVKSEKEERIRKYKEMIGKR